MTIAGVVLAYSWGWAQGTFELTVPWWLDTPSVFGFYGFLLLVLDRWAWRWGPIAQLLRVPDLSGRWKGTLRTSHDDFRQEHPVQLTVTQSWSMIRMVLETSSSASHSVAAHVIESGGTEPYEIVYQYDNTPKAGVVSTMHGHRGTAHLRLSADASKLTGEYYTGRDRQNHGSMEFTREG